MNFFAVIAALLILPLLFSCGISSLGMSIHMATNFGMEHHGEGISSCCDVAQTGTHASEGYNPADIIMPSIHGTVNIVIFLGVLFSVIFVLRDQVSLVGTNYFRQMRRRLGSFRILEKYCTLFGIGILHPRIW